MAANSLSTSTALRCALALSALLTLGFGAAPAHAQVSCTGLCLQQVSCPANGTTSITGTVYAPNGTDPLPNVLVYIPNISGPSTLPAFPQGVECNPNGEPALGSPLVSTVTAINGTFTLNNVPVGSNIPLVIQAGKWRRIFTVPTVGSCVTTAATTAFGSGLDTTPVAAGHNIHLPQNQSEGDIPKIAIVTGSVDAVECVLTKMGVSANEFTDPTGSGRINLYYGDTPGYAGVTLDANTPAEGVLESNPATLDQYDLVMLPCQGAENTTIATSNPSYLTNIGNYANAGGRIYATHYSYDLLYDNPAFANTVNWHLNQGDPGSPQIGYINTAIPQGLQLAQWLQQEGDSTTLGQIPVNTLRHDQDGFPTGSSAQSYLSIDSPSESIQFTFPTPVTAPAASQCGRVLFNEYHVENASTSPSETFPAECTAAAITPQEQLLEFTLFDLGTFTAPTSNPTASISFTNTPATLTQGDSADTVAVTVTNTSTTTATNATLTAAITLPSGLTATSIAPAIPATSGWSCSLGTLTCTRTTGLNAQASDDIIVTFSVANSATSPQTISATVSNGNLAAPVTATDALVIPLTLSPAAEPLPNASYNVPYSQQFTAGGGDAPYTYNVSGALTPGLSLNSATGLVSGTPTNASDGLTYAFQITVQDTGGNALTQQYTIAVPPVFSGLTSTLSVAGSAVAGSTVPVTATVLDTAGNPVAGATVTFAETASGGTTSAGQIFTPAIATTNASGVAVTQLVYTAADTLTLSATVSGPVTGAITQTPTITLVAPAYIVTVNSDESSGNGVAANCVDPNLPTYTTAANANCGLRDAVAAANALTGVTTNISFAGSQVVGTAASPAVILIAQTTPVTISQNVNLNGPGANLLTIEGGTTPLSTSNNGILQIEGGNVALSGLTLANGYGIGFGGAINDSAGTLTVSYSIFTGNQVGDNGGAISANSLTVSDSTFVGNQAANRGGAILVQGSLTVSNSTFSGNQANGPGADDGGAIDANGSLTVANSTFSGNQAGANGGAIYANGSLTVTNSIFSGDSAFGGSGIYALIPGTATNIVYHGDTFDGVTPTNSINADPNLGPLGNYGGTTQTFLPLPGSAAICAGTVPSLNSVPLTADQRGVPISPTRYGQTACYDVGAVQTAYALTLGPTPVVPSLVTPGSAISPAPVATLTENGTLLTAGIATVNMSDADSDLSGSATVSVPTSIATGQSTFSNLLFTGAETSDTLTATLPLNPNLNPALSLSATSNSFQVGKLTPTIVAFAPASITYGTPALSLSGSLSWPGPVMPTGAVTFLIDSTISVPASCTSSGACSATYNSASLSAGPHSLIAGIAADTLYSAATSSPVPFFVSPAPLTVSIVGNPTKPYDGTTAATLAPSNYQVNGLVGTDAITVNQPSGTYAAATAGSETVTAALTTSSFAATTGSLNNYTLPSSATGPGTITQVPTVTTVTCSPSSVTYNGAPQTPCTASVTGAGGLSQSVTPVSYSANVNAGVNTASASATYAGDTNHTGSTGSATFTISPAPLTVTAGYYYGEYDGGTHGLFGCNVSANFDGITCTNSIPSVGPDVGSGVVTPVIHGSTSNYSVTTNNGSWNITARGLVLTAGSFTGTYNGSAQTPTACTSSYGGVTCTNSPASVGPGASSGIITPVQNIVTGIPADYVIVTSNGSYSIAQASSVTNISCPTSVVYNGAAQSPCTATATGAGSFSTTLPVTYSGNTNVGPASASATFTGDANHTGSTNSTTFAITPLPVTITAGSYSGVYNGSAHAPSACTSSYAGVSCANSPASVGPGVSSGTVNPVASVITGNASDYTVTKATGSYTITKAPTTGTITWTHPAAITYGTLLSSTQLDASSTVMGTFTYNPASGALLPAGSQTLSATFSPTDSSDYSPGAASVPLTVNKATTTTTIAVTTTQTVTGTTATITATVHPQISGTPTGTVTYYDGTTALGSAAVGTPFTTPVLPAGTDQLSAVYSGDSNFLTSTSAKSPVTGVAPTTVTLTVNTHSCHSASTVSYTVVVTLKSRETVSGTITVYDGTTVIGTFNLPPTGVVVDVTPKLSVGTHNLLAVYSGNSLYPPGESAVETVTVTAP